MVISRGMLVGVCCGLAAVSACTTVRHVEPAALLTDAGPARVWVTQTDNTVVPVFDPLIRRDTLRGKLNGARVKIPMTHIRSIQAKMPDHARTAILALVLGVAAVSTLYVVGVSQAGGPASNGITCGTTIRGDPILAC
jgi:hypothetical protein